MALWKCGQSKILNHNWGAHDHCVYCCLRRKSVHCTELLKSYLAGGNRIINCHKQTNRNDHNWNIWQNTWPTFFYKNHICFFLSVLKKTNTLHLHSMCGGHGRRKDFFQGEPLGDFPKFFQGGDKSDKTLFLLFEIAKNNLFCCNFQNPGRNKGPLLPPLLTPIVAA